MNKRWKKRDAVADEDVRILTSELGIGRTLASLLVQRDVNDLETAKRFFRPQLDDLHDPFLMKDMDLATTRLQDALESGERILVYGDYDVDGTTAVTLVFSFLKNLGASCEFYIPDRYEEGYGFSFKGVDFASSEGITLIITLDCGIKDAEKIVYAKEKGIDVIICDHHNPDQLPPAYAVLDPKRPDCEYPYKGLSGCGVGFKLLQAWCIKRDYPMEALFEYLDLLTISIGADIVPITGENRVLAHYGLQQIGLRKRPGIEAMLFQSGFKKPYLNITDVVFVLAPRINAAGRIFNGTRAVQLLLAETMEAALEISPALEENNNQRKHLDKEITKEAVEQVLSDPKHAENFSIVVFSETWHKGVVGIVASRLVETFYKPTIVLVKDGDKLTGSARSIDGVDLFDALSACSTYLQKFGGHTMAAGLTLSIDHLESFKNAFDNEISSILHQQLPIQQIEYDAEIDFDEVDEKFHRILRQFGPFGPGNMNPVFLARQVVNDRFTRTVGDTNAHLKLHIKQKKSGNKTLDGIAFNLGEWSEHLLSGGEADILFTVEENEYRGNVTLQLNVKDMRESVVHEVSRG